jgi:hypothetical protein
MATVLGVACAVFTGKLKNARTDGCVYLGLGGREFALDAPRPTDDFEFGSQFTYIFGAVQKAKLLATTQTKVTHPWNDVATGFVLDSVELRDLPKYIRFEPEDGDDEWHLAYADVRIFFDEVKDGRKMSSVLAFRVPEKRFTGLWLSQVSGKVAHLTQEFTP